MLGVYLKSKNFKVEKDFKFRLNTFFSFGTTKRLFNKEYGIFFNKENYILHNTFFQEVKYNFFLQNIITQNSINMETCSKEIYLAKRISKREFREKRIRHRWKDNIVKKGNKLAVKVASKLYI